MVRRLGAIVALAVLLSGCSGGRTTPERTAPDSTPALGLHQPETTFTVGPLEFLAAVRTETATGFPQLERVAVDVRVRNTSEATVTVIRLGDLEAALYSSAGEERVSVDGSGSGRGFSGEQHNKMAPGGEIKLSQTFEVGKGETGLVLALEAQPGPDVRWLIR